MNILSRIAFSWLDFSQPVEGTGYDRPTDQSGSWSISPSKIILAFRCFLITSSGHAENGPITPSCYCHGEGICIRTKCRKHLLASVVVCTGATWFQDFDTTNWECDGRHISLQTIIPDLCGGRNNHQLKRKLFSFQAIYTIGW